LTEVLLEIIQRLNDQYGKRTWKRWRKPLPELIRTILSQNTTDKNSLRAFARLKDRFKNWEAVMGANTEEIADAIRIGGLANIKAEKIQTILREIKEQQGKLSLEFLSNWDVSKATGYLESFNGVGPKTSACVLIFSFNFPILPVDTHIHRVSNRLGIISTKSREKSQEQLNELVPREHIYSFHLNLIEHGRKICYARNPNCEDCFLKDLCQYYQNKNEGKKD
jgi:endonuclease-3